MHFTADDKKKIKVTLFIVACSIIIYVFISNFPVFWNALHVFVRVLSPFIMAFLLSFIINIPMSFIENRILSKFPLKAKTARFIAIILAFLVIILLLILIFSIVLPQLYSSIRSFILSIPKFLDDFTNFVKGADWLGSVKKPILESIDAVRSLSITDYLWNRFGNTSLSNSFSKIMSELVPTLNNIISGFVTSFLVLVFSIYMLASKETLVRNCKELAYSFLPESFADKIMYVSYTAYDNFYNFFTGQFQEALSLAFMTFVGMKILGMNLALMVSILVGFGALIPMVGAILAGFLGFIILLSSSPVEGIGFLIFIIILQQFDGNIVYPKIVGQSVGLPAIWVLLGVTIGGSFMGIFGMLIFIPIFSTIYDILSDYKTKRLTKKNIQVSLK